jgi:predicted Zn-dependent protease
MNRFSRTATALALVASLLGGSLSVFAQTAQPQEPAKTQTETKQDPKKDQQEKAKPASNKALSPSEDPSMIGKRNINKGIIASMSGSTEKEVRLGRELAAQVDREAKFVDDPVITEYINRVGQNIVLHSDAKVAFTIKVIDSDEVNAFALPGGFFYVNKGLLLAADNEAELAGVMAHEIAHVAARHAVENNKKAELAQYAVLIPSILLGGGLGQLIYQGGGFATMLGFMKFTRGAEEEADKLGIQYLYAAGYDPTAMATMFEKIESKSKKKPGFVSKLFATHPATADRRAASLALAARFPEKEEYVISSSEFQRVKSRLLRLSNARASSSGALPGAEDGAPGRPTLKRRQSTADEPATTTTPDGEQKPVETKEPPKLKRNDGSKPPQP